MVPIINPNMWEERPMQREREFGDDIDDWDADNPNERNDDFEEEDEDEYNDDSFEADDDEDDEDEDY